MRRRWVLGCILAVGLVACADDEPVTAPGSSTNAGGAGGTNTGGTSAGGGGAGGGPSCGDQWANGTTEPDPDGPSTQIHGTSTFDGDHLWMAWNRPDSGSLFDVWLAAFACDGSLVTGPIEVTQADDNELDPVLSVSGDRLLVAWVSDNGSGPNNLDIRYRIFSLSGAALTDTIELAATRNGAAVTGNAISPSLAPINGGWMLAGAWGHDDAPAFQAFVVELDIDGVVQGDASDADLDPAFGQTAISVAADEAGVHVAWQIDSTTSTAPAAWWTTLGGTATMLGDPGARPHLAPGPWAVWDTDGSDIVVQPPGATPKPLNATGLVHSPQLAVVDDEATLLWMEVTSGIKNRIHVATLGADGTPGVTMTLATQEAPSVYPVDLTMVDTTHAVVVYQDGTSPDFRLKAEWLTLPR